MARPRKVKPEQQAEPTNVVTVDQETQDQQAPVDIQVADTPVPISSKSPNDVIVARTPTYAKPLFIDSLSAKIIMAEPSSLDNLKHEKTIFILHTGTEDDLKRDVLKESKILDTSVGIYQMYYVTRGVDVAFVVTYF